MPLHLESLESPQIPQLKGEHTVVQKVSRTPLSTIASVLTLVGPRVIASINILNTTPQYNHEQKNWTKKLDWSLPCFYLVCINQSS